jgi:hypothetical protein
MFQGDDTDRGAWVELTDENGHGYWHNQMTNETSWYDPAATAAATTDDDAAASAWAKLTDENGHEYWHNTVTNETSWYDPSASSATGADAEAAWTKLKDENGDEYWYNSITKETSWEDWSTAATKIGDDAASAWTNVKDENGYDYWHNPTTNETSWDDPCASAAAATAADLPTPPPSAAPVALTTATMPPVVPDSSRGAAQGSEAGKGGKPGKGGGTATTVIKKRKLPTFLEMLHNRSLLSVFEGYIQGREARVTLAYTTFKCFWQENEALHASSMIPLADANDFFAKFIKSGEFSHPNITESNRSLSTNASQAHSIHKKTKRNPFSRGRISHRLLGGGRKSGRSCASRRKVAQSKVMLPDDIRRRHVRGARSEEEREDFPGIPYQ